MHFHRRSFLTLSAGATAASLLRAAAPEQAAAKAPLATAQAPSYYRFKVGTLEVTAVTDGMLELPLALFPAAEPAQAKTLFEKAHRPEKAPTAVNTYVVNTGDKLILVDTGYGSMAGPAAGYLQDNLKAAGFNPAEIDVVYLTHMHPDHVGGLLDQQGKPVFGNADILVNEKEHAFWTDEGITTKAPAESQKFFRIAQAAVKPYEKKLHLYKDGEEVAPGLTAAVAAGHTPGHSMLTLSSGNQTAVIWGDIVHVAALQFPRPEWAIAFDSDQAQAIETRKKVFDKFATDGTLIAGMHLDFPGIGYVAREPQGYSLQRAMWTPKLI